MRSASQALFGFLTALLSLALLLGALSLSFIENGALVSWLPTSPPTATPTLTSTSTPVNTPVAGQPTFTASPTMAPSATFTLVPPTNCPPPAGWMPVRVLPGDTLQGLADYYRVSPEELASANCLVTATLLPDSILYVPPRLETATPTRTLSPTQTSIPCGPPASWIRYQVRPGDTLFSLGLSYGVTVRQLQIANCMGSSTSIRAGEFLFVPNVPTRTPRPSITPTPTSTFTPAPPTQVPPSATPSNTPLPTSTNTPVPTSTPTPVPTETPTDTPTETPTETPTDTPEVVLPTSETPPADGTGAAP